MIDEADRIIDRLTHSNEELLEREFKKIAKEEMDSKIRIAIQEMAMEMQRVRDEDHEED